MGWSYSNLGEIVFNRQEKAKGKNFLQVDTTFDMKGTCYLSD